MFKTSKYEKRAALYFHRASPEFRNGCGHNRWTHKLARRLGLAAVIVCCWTGYAAAVDAQITSTAPIKIAVFAFELEDSSAAANQGETSHSAQSLAQSTEEAKQQLLQSGRYRLIDTTDADMGAAKGQGLRNCKGCEAAIARKLGADQALIGVVIKVSMTEYVVRIQISDAQNGEIISSSTTDLRMGADYSWSRGVRWLMQNRVLAGGNPSDSRKEPRMRTLAVLDIEVTGDTSDASRAGEWEQRCAKVSERLRQEIRNRHVYAVLDNAPAADYIAELKSNQNLHACNGCELDIARRLGAERVLIGSVFRMSHLVLTLHIEIKDVASGRTVMRRVLDFRGDNDTGWERAVLYLVREMTGQPGA